MDSICERKHTVLIVDDEPAIIDGIRRSLRREPYEILGATSAREAFGILRTIGIDVLVVDKQMPRINGVQLLTAIRNMYPEMRRIMLSGTLSMESAVRAVNMGRIERFLIKPCNEVELAIAIRDCLSSVEGETNEAFFKNNSRLEDLMLDDTFSGVAKVKRDSQGRVLIDEE